jgi:hypothetical protein
MEMMKMPGGAGSAVAAGAAHDKAKATPGGSPWRIGARRTLPPYDQSKEDPMTSLSLRQRSLSADAPKQRRRWATIDAPEFRDARGALTVCQTGDCIPFGIARVYFIHGVPPSAQRGGHAHRELEQVMFAVSGSFRVLLNDGHHREAFELTNPSRGLYTGPMVWRELEAFSHDAVCMVLASGRYNSSEYIRSYETFEDEAQQQTAA